MFIIIAGIVFVISGILDLVKKNWAGGGVSLVIGIAILVLGRGVAAAIVLLVLGILIAIKGIVALVNALKKDKKNALDFVFPALTVVVGLMLVLVLVFDNGLDIMIIIVGVLLMIDGIIGIASSLKK